MALWRWPTDGRCVGAGVVAGVQGEGWQGRVSKGMGWLLGKMWKGMVAEKALDGDCSRGDVAWEVLKGNCGKGHFAECFCDVINLLYFNEKLCLFYVLIFHLFSQC